MKTLFTLTVVSSLVSLLTSPASAQMMGPIPPVPMTVDQFSSARIAQDVPLSIRVDRVKRTDLYAEILASKSETAASLTGQKIELNVPEDTPTVMGSVRDVVPGAVLFVYGILTRPGHVDVKRLVIDTKFVKIQ